MPDHFRFNLLSPRLIIITLVIIMTNCKNENADKDSLLIVNIDNADTLDIRLSELVSSSDLIFLENKEEALLNQPSGFAFSDDFILETDFEQHPAKLFKKSGEFIRDLGTIGNGPGEFASVKSPQIQDENFWLLVGGNYDGPKEGWFYVYDKNGDLINQINATDNEANRRNRNSVLVHDGQIIVPGNISSKSMLAYRKIADDSMIQVRNRIDPGYFAYTTNNSTAYPIGDKFIFKIGEADTIYSYTTSTLQTKPVAVVYTENHRYDGEKIKQARSSTGPDRFNNIMKATEGGFGIFLKGETNQYYLFTANSKLLFVDKKTGKSFYGRIIDDIRTGLVLDELPMLYQNQFLYYHFPAIELLEKVASQMTSAPNEMLLSFQKSISGKLHENDNDILLVCRIK